jgi:hypothetical protein
LGPLLEKKLLAYAAAATAAGVGLLAFPQTAEAKVIYTAVNQQISSYDPLIYIDLNHDGINDFALYFWFAEIWSGFRAYPANLTNPSSGIMGYRRIKGIHASALHAGDRIGPGRRFQQGKASMAFFTQYSSSSVVSGSWVNVTNRYLGFKFMVNGEAHYGWARLSIQGSKGLLTGYAYETEPNKSIVAGKTDGPVKAKRQSTERGTIYPATLGELARGAAAPAK